MCCKVVWLWKCKYTLMWRWTSFEALLPGWKKPKHFGHCSTQDISNGTRPIYLRLHPQSHCTYWDRETGPMESKATGLGFKYARAFSIYSAESSNSSAGDKVVPFMLFFLKLTFQFASLQFVFLHPTFSYLYCFTSNFTPSAAPSMKLCGDDLEQSDWLLKIFRPIRILETNIA